MGGWCSLVVTKLGSRRSPGRSEPRAVAPAFIRWISATPPSHEARQRCLGSRGPARYCHQQRWRRALADSGRNISGRARSHDGRPLLRSVQSDSGMPPRHAKTRKWSHRERDIGCRSLVWPGAAAYTAARRAMLSLSDSLRAELPAAESESHWERLERFDTAYWATIPAARNGCPKLERECATSTRRGRASAPRWHRRNATGTWPSFSVCCFSSTPGAANTAGHEPGGRIAHLELCDLDLDRLRLPVHRLRQFNAQHAVLELRFHLRGVHLIRQDESPDELSVLALDAVEFLSLSLPFLSCAPLRCSRRRRGARS